MYTITELEKDISDINASLSAIRIDRGQRYGKPNDTLANVRNADPQKGWRAAYINAVECMNRLENFFDSTAINDRDFENATDDLINYAYYIKILRRQQNEDFEPSKPDSIRKIESLTYNPEK